MFIDDGANLFMLLIGKDRYCEMEGCLFYELVERQLLMTGMLMCEEAALFGVCVPMLYESLFIVVFIGLLLLIGSILLLLLGV